MDRCFAKFLTLFGEPYRITRKFGNTSNELENPADKTIRGRFNCRLLRKYNNIGIRIRIVKKKKERKEETEK